MRPYSFCARFCVPLPALQRFSIFLNIENPGRIYIYIWNLSRYLCRPPSKALVHGRLRRRLAACMQPLSQQEQKNLSNPKRPPLRDFSPRESDSCWKASRSAPRPSGPPSISLASSTWPWKQLEVSRPRNGEQVSGTASRHQPQKSGRTPSDAINSIWPSLAFQLH